MSQIVVERGVTTFERVAIVIDGLEVGHAYLFIIANDNIVYGHVEDVVVFEQYRGQGFGKVLMEKIEERAKIYRCSCLRLTSNPSRIVARGLYESLGFKLVSEGFRKEL